MARKKIWTARLPTERERKITYGKRRKGILKKAYEISTLCDIQVLFLMFSPSDKLDHFSSQSGIWKILKQFIQKVHSMSETERENLLVSQINSDVVHDEIELRLLQLQNKMMHPSREAFISEEKFKKLTRGLAKVYHMIARRREKHEGQKHSLNTSDDSTRDTQNSERQLLMQQPQEGVPQGQEHMQQSVHCNIQMEQLAAVPESGMWGPPQEEQHLQHQRAEMLGMEDPSTSLNASRQLPMPQMQAPPDYEMRGPVQGGENILEQEVSAFGMGNLSLSSGRHFGAQQNIQTPTFMSEQIESQPFTDLGEASDDGVQWWDNFY